MRTTTSRPCPQTRSRSPLFGLAPDGVYPAAPVTRHAGELLPHRFTLATRPGGPFGGLFSVALALALRPVGVTDHPVLWSPDFPPVAQQATSEHPINSGSELWPNRLAGDRFRDANPLFGHQFGRCRSIPGSHGNDKLPLLAAGIVATADREARPGPAAEPFPGTAVAGPSGLIYWPSCHPVGRQRPCFRGFSAIPV